MGNLQDRAAELRPRVRGEVLLPGDDGYDKARTIWNAMIDRKPAVIIRCYGTADVRAGVNFARDNNQLLAIKGCGHNIGGLAVCDNGVMLDLSPMNSVRVDPATRRARVGPGATLADFDFEAQAYGLATPVGINSTTGIAGLTLGGGFGWLSRKYGLTVDNLVSAEVVTASGERVVASDSENQDLFWAIRGGGGNFGVVTEFEFKLHPVGPEVVSGLLVYPFDQASHVMREYRKFIQDIHKDLNVWVVIRKAPPLPFLPEAVHGTEIIALAVFFDGPSDQADRLIKPLREIAPLLGEHVGPNPYTGWQQAFDPLLTPGARNYWKSHNFVELEDGAIDCAIEYAGQLPSPQCEIFFGLVGGAVNERPVGATAYAHRSANIVMNVHARWDDPEDDEACILWARDYFSDIAPFAEGGVYVNFLTGEEQSRIAAAYGPNYDPLVEIKSKYDPNNLFRMNQNIKPVMHATSV